jgi:hypothetical protein
MRKSQGGATLDSDERGFPRNRARVWEYALLIQGTWSYSRRWEWRLAWFVDLIHWPIAVLMVTGAFWMPPTLYSVFMGVTWFLQGVVLGCPVVVVSGWLRRRVDPAFSQGDGLVTWIYRRWGRARALPMLAFGFTLGATLIWWKFSA